MSKKEDEKKSTSEDLSTKKKKASLLHEYSGLKDQDYFKKSLSEAQRTIGNLNSNKLLREVQKTLKTCQASNYLKEYQKQIIAIQRSDPFKEYQKHIKALHASNPMKEYQKYFKTIRTSNPFKEHQKQIKALHTSNPMKEYQKYFKTIQARDPFKEYQKQIKALYASNPIKDSQEFLKKFQTSSYFKEIRKTLTKYHEITDIYKNVFSQNLPVNTFEEAYQEVISSLYNAQSLGDMEVTEAAINVTEELNSQIIESKPSKLSLEFYLNFFVAFMFFIYSLNLAEQSEVRIIESINTAQTNIIERIDDLRDPVEKEIFYVVERAVNLRTKPTTKRSEIINVLYPNQKVRLVDRKGKWIKVEYYNHLLNIHEHGWCFKKYSDYPQSSASFNFC